MSYKVKYYLKREFRNMKAAKMQNDYSLMHFYEHQLDGGLTALFYAGIITEEEYRFLTNLSIRITYGKRKEV